MSACALSAVATATVRVPTGWRGCVHARPMVLPLLPQQEQGQLAFRFQARMTATKVYVVLHAATATAPLLLVKCRVEKVPQAIILTSSDENADAF
jgi:hypothetical protein